MERCSKTKKKKISSGIIYWISILNKSDLSHDTIQVWDFLKVTEWPPNSKLFRHPVCYHYEPILYFSFLMDEGVNAYYVKNYTISNNDQLKEIPSSFISFWYLHLYTTNGISFLALSYSGKTHCSW